jgi:ergothioneine biosynthesis protein EgtB
LAQALKAQRDYTLALYADLPEALWRPDQVPYLSIINPPLWELAHIAWFAEYFAVRHPLRLQSGREVASCLETADALFDSRHVPHKSRWGLAYPARADCMAYMDASLARVLTALSEQTEDSPYLFQLVLLHEDMHAEALAMTLSTLGLPFPAALPSRTSVRPGKDVHLPGGVLVMGDSKGRNFLFDNEKPPQPVDVAPFTIASSPVTEGEITEFRESKAYNRQDIWSDAGWQWHLQHRPNMSKTASMAYAAMHISFFEAEAYCRWQNRRLPTEAEWEFAATQSPEFGETVGHVWEWTSDAFAPYPGFVADVAYAEYSMPWFLTHLVLKGGSFVTHPRLRYPQYRNFYTPERSDMFCGFRTCASV